MRMKLGLLSVLLGTAIGTVAFAQDKVVIGYAAPDLVGGQAQIEAGFARGAATFGWEVVAVSAGNDAQKQLNDINDLIAQGVQAIVAVPVDSAGICVAVAAAKSRTQQHSTGRGGCVGQRLGVALELGLSLQDAIDLAPAPRLRLELEIASGKGLPQVRCRKLQRTIVTTRHRPEAEHLALLAIHPLLGTAARIDEQQHRRVRPKVRDRRIARGCLREEVTR